MALHLTLLLLIVAVVIVVAVLEVLSLVGLLTSVASVLLEFVAYFVSGFKVNSFLAAFLGSLLISVVTWLANYFINAKPETPKRQDVIDLEKGDDGKWR